MAARFVRALSLSLSRARAGVLYLNCDPQVHAADLRFSRFALSHGSLLIISFCDETNEISVKSIFVCMYLLVWL